ncbi:MAG: peptidoglycan DD-metalloendopeptidase family protein [Verrucomicrobiae bacterium]|nr:peptidoglycan DD-metalloendopeptidase family protein [Verrucomicrobiae bacterium]
MNTPIKIKIEQQLPTNKSAIHRSALLLFLLSVVSIQAQLLPAPSLIGPANGATGVSTTPTLSWTSVTGANRYWVIMSTSQADLPTDPSAVSCPGCVNTGVSGVTGSTSYTLPNAFPYGGTTRTLNPGTTYYWKVQGFVAGGQNGNYSAVRSFTTAGAVQLPTVQTVNASSVTASSAVLHGTIASDGGSTIVERRFDWGNSSGNLNQFTANVSISGNNFSYSLSGLSPNTTYYFRAWAKNGSSQVGPCTSTPGWGCGSILSFTTSTLNYTISVSASPSGGGTVGGGGTYAAGSSRTVTATANSGYTFVNWTEGGSVVSSSASYTFTLNANRTLVANFTATPVNYTISVNASPSGGGTVGGGGTYAAGSSRTVTATANSGYTFANWTEGGTVVSTSASYTFTLNANRTLVANFTSSPVNYTISVSASPGAGGTVSGGGTYAAGSSRTVTATANSGYTFANWTEGGTVVSSSASYTFTLGANRALVANFAVSQALSFRFPLAGYTPYTAPASSVFDHSGLRYVANNEVVAFTGEKGTVRDNVEPPVVTGGQTLYSYKKTDGATFSCNGNYQGTSLTGPTTLNYDGHPGWDYAVPVGTPVYAVADGQVVLVTSDSASGKYVRLQHGSDYQSQYLHLDEQLVVQNANVTKGQLIGKSGNSGGVAPHLHFEVKKLVAGNWVSVDPYGWTGAGSDPYQVANINLWEGGTALNYTISVSASPSGGGTVGGGGTYAAGSSRTVTATANSGYTFVNWTEGGSVVSSSASYTFTLNANRTLVANFTSSPVNYTISVSASPGAGGTVSGGGTYAAGSSRTVTATANSGYTFANWTEGGTVVSTSASYTFTLNANRTLVANFTTTPLQPPKQLTEAVVSNSFFRFTINGPVGSGFVIQVSSNLTHWTSLLTNTVPSSGTRALSEPVPTNSMRRFYRAVPLSQGPLILQPGPEDGQDIWTTSWYSNGTNTVGANGIANETLQVGGWADYYHVYLKFNLTGLPSHASSAVIELYSFTGWHSGFVNVSMNLDRVTQDWEAIFATTIMKWVDQPAAVNVRTIPAAAKDSWYSIDVTDLYNAWQAGTYPNHGIALRPTGNANQWNYFWSSRYMVDPNLRPKLVVTP